MKIITRTENAYRHHCTFFLPVHLPSRSLYLVHHRKAEDWIPPGGHIELGETPLDTVRREFAEELGYTLKKEHIEMIGTTSKNVAKPIYTCEIHDDLWHIVYTEKISFTADPGEFFNAGWFTFNEAIDMVKTPQYNEVIKAFVKKNGSERKSG